MVKILHLGAGQKFIACYLGKHDIDYITNDYIALPGIRWVSDLNITPWPFDNNYFDIVIAIDILEHLESPKLIFEEIYRVLKNGGDLQLQVPHFGSLAHATDMTHKHGFTPNSFGFFIPEHPYCRSQPWYSNARFICSYFAIDDQQQTSLQLPDDWMDAMLKHKVIGNMQLNMRKVSL